ncbi:hypothetical protein JNM87_06540 [Candidatus Saccharibacteria bacterium]|nr:hypothetical protein [Candidatus Saccharibacteria bacterium]
MSFEQPLSTPGRKSPSEIRKHAEEILGCAATGAAHEGLDFTAFGVDIPSQPTRQNALDASQHQEGDWESHVATAMEIANPPLADVIPLRS